MVGTGLGGSQKRARLTKDQELEFVQKLNSLKSFFTEEVGFPLWALIEGARQTNFQRKILQNRPTICGSNSVGGQS